MTATPDRTKRARRPGLLGAAAAFILLCGLILVVVPPLSAGDGALRQEDARVRQIVNDALRESNRAQDALTDANYGEVRTHLQRVEGALMRALTQLNQDRDESN